jgi:hypothetical protein
MRIISDGEGAPDKLLLVVHGGSTNEIKARGVHDNLCVIFGEDSTAE